MPVADWFYAKYSPSALEFRFLRFLEKNFPSESFLPQKRIELSNGRERFIDFYWKDQNIHIEVDGHEKFKHYYLGDFFHRQNMLIVDDTPVLRFTWKDVNELVASGIEHSYLYEVLNKTKNRPLTFDFKFKSKVKISRPWHYQEQRYSYGLAQFEEDFQKLYGLEAQELFERNLRILVEYFYFDAPYTFISHDYQIVIDPSPIHSLVELDHYLRQQNYLVLADFEIYKFTDLTEARQARLLEQVVRKLLRANTMV